MMKKLGTAFDVFICAVLIFQLIGCGTIMYPERKGQKSGRIDIGVAVLDGIGLLFFLIPGIIAYAVDFNNGTIYLPHSMGSLNLKDMKQVKFDPKHNTMASVQEIIKKETGCDVKLYQGKMKITKLKSSDDMMAHFAEALSGIQSGRIVLLNK
ncbi:MAG: hypothetical protein HQL24_08965 [Candidatus Omnitrophica bacterium]|nr:hypothetical protein [Candidatus Omnitrophota bacterium]